MIGLYLSRPGEGTGEYGPVSLPELRLMIRAGIPGPDARLRDDVETTPRALADWPELRAAVAATALREWRGSRAHRGLVASGTRLGESRFEAVNQAGDDRAPSALEVLAINRAHEPDRIIEMPPWWKQVWFRNFMRWLPVGGFGFGSWILMSLKTGAWAGTSALCLPITVIWGWYVWIMRPIRWNGAE